MEFSNLQKWHLQTQDFLKRNSIEIEDLETLRNVIRFHEWRYYVKDDPIITDRDYDKLYDLLKNIEQAHPSLISDDSPTQRVGNDIVNEFNTIQHIQAMLSLNNSYNEDDLYEFDKSVHKLLSINLAEPIDYVVEPKFDGGSIALVYEDDKLVRAATRGNGIKGEDITSNIKTLPSIPLRAQFSQFNIKIAELRGEALIRKDRFLKINQLRAERDETQFANPRNAATGGLRMKNPSQTAERGIDAFIYQMGYIENMDGATSLTDFTYHHQYINLLEQLGFKVPVEVSKTCRGIEDVISYCKEWELKREDYPYEIDGMVIKVDHLAYQERMGSTGHHPRWAIAFKFKAKQATSTLLDVEFQVGKIGTITPVAKIEPVRLAGVTISSISLHNEDFINEKDIRINDSILIERAGDVIPYIVKSFPELRNENTSKIQFPESCPVCHHKLFRIEGEAAWRCVNNACSAQVMQRMIHFVSRDAMDIDGLGPSYLERFRQEGWLNDIADIYNLNYENISQLSDFGQKSADNLKEAINQSKHRSLARLLHGLSIHHVGKKVSSIIAERVEHIRDLAEWTEEDLIAIKDIGPVVAANIVSFFQDAKNLELLNRLEAHGVNMEQTEEDKPIEVSADSPFVGKSILFTGSLKHFTRNEAKKLAEKNGARNISAVSSKLDILVVGEKAGSKLKKAQELGTVKIITEDEFVQMIDEHI